MSSVEHLRVFVNERLTAAAEEIFRVFKETIVEYEEEISRQSRLLDIVWKPQIKLHRIELPQKHVCKEEEDLIDQQIWNQERESTLDQEDPESPQIKEEQEELCTSQDGEQLVLKLETDAFLLTPTHEENDHSDPEPKGDHQLLCNNSHVAENQDQKRREDGDSGSTRNAESRPKKQHCESKSVSHDTDNSNLSNLSEIKPKTKTAKKFKCDTCGKAFECQSHLNIHMRCHTGERPYGCTACGKNFTTRYNLNIHTRIHTGEKPFLCKSCGKKFSTKAQWRKHIRIHTNERPYTCTYACTTCGKNYQRSSGLLTHMRMHTGERPYLCMYCEQRFRDRSTWKRHMTTHTGERPYTCTTCGKDFRANGNLKKHMRTHTGEKPFTCTTCGKDFTVRDSLKMHMRIHTGERPYVCTTCGKDYKRSNELSTHMRTHTGEKLYLCKYCGKRFNYRSSHHKHMRTHTE